MDAINHIIYQLKGYMIILLILSFSSCSKEKKGPNNTAIYGKVLDYYTLEPISDVQVIMKDGFGGTGGLFGAPFATDLTDTDVTDENGDFFVELKNHYYSALMGAFKDGYMGDNYFIEDYNKSHFFEPGIYPDYIIRLKPKEDEKSH